MVNKISICWGFFLLNFKCISVYLINGNTSSAIEDRRGFFFPSLCMKLPLCYVILSLSFVWLFFIVAFLTADCALLIMMQESNYLTQEKMDSSQSFFLIKKQRYIPFLWPVLRSEMFSCVWELDWDLSLHSCVSTQDQNNRYAICYRSFIHGVMWDIKQISFVFS